MQIPFLKKLLKKESPKLRAIRSINNLLFSDFIQIVVTGNLGTISKAEWESIIAEYLSRTSNNQAKHIMSIEKQITLLKGDLLITQALLNSLAVNFDEEVAERLKKRYGMQFTEETYVENISAVITQCKGKQIRLQQLEHQLTESSEVTDKKPNEADYYNQLAVLSKWFGFAIVASQITVADYCSYLSQFQLGNKPNAK